MIQPPRRKKPGLCVQSSHKLSQTLENLLQRTINRLSRVAGGIKALVFVGEEAELGAWAHPLSPILHAEAIRSWMSHLEDLISSQIHQLPSLLMIPPLLPRSTLQMTLLESLRAVVEKHEVVSTLKSLARIRNASEMACL